MKVTLTVVVLQLVGTGQQVANALSGSSSVCVDTPVGWEARYYTPLRIANLGNCGTAVDEKWCNSTGGYGSGWFDLEVNLWTHQLLSFPTSATFDDLCSVQGVPMTQACCACGGGTWVLPAEKGCTDPGSRNFNSAAKIDDGSCIGNPACGTARGDARHELDAVKERRDLKYVSGYQNTMQVCEWQLKCADEGDVLMLEFSSYGDHGESIGDLLQVFAGDSISAPLLLEWGSESAWGSISPPSGAQIGSQQGTMLIDTMLSATASP
eukprot:COSAG02_NODE_17451_length_1002_cov_1.251384_1_plen_265_part_10